MISENVDRTWPGLMLASVSRDDAFRAYQDDKGEPQFVESAVLFWDVIGVQALSESEDRLDNLKRLRRALDRARGYAGTEDEDEPHASTWFTDNVVVGSPSCVIKTKRRSWG